jgi:tetratricopeptide (TPR) repeat protein
MMKTSIRTGLLIVLIAVVAALDCTGKEEGDTSQRTEETAESLQSAEWQGTLQATWIKMFGFPQATTMILNLGHDMTFTIQVQPDPEPEVAGTYSVQGNRITFADKEGMFACKEDEGEGIYEFELREEFLELSLIQDSCRGRRNALFGTAIDSAAIFSYNQRIETDSTDVEAYARRGRIFTIMQWRDEAFADLDKAIELDPENIEAHEGRGHALALFYNSRFDEALEEFNRILELDPDHRWAYLHRGFAKRDLGDMEGACEDWKKARDLGYPLVQEEVIDRLCK